MGGPDPGAEREDGGGALDRAVLAFVGVTGTKEACTGVGGDDAYEARQGDEAKVVLLRKACDDTQHDDPLDCGGDHRCQELADG